MDVIIIVQYNGLLISLIFIGLICRLVRIYGILFDGFLKKSEKACRGTCRVKAVT